MRKSNKKAFTLIELLAVIVILAIIALIAVPVIINIINKANKSAFKDTAYGIINAGELYFAQRQLEPNGMLKDETFDLSSMTELELKGEVPAGEILITKEGNIALAVKNNRYCITKSIIDKDVTITEDYETCELPKILITNKIMSSYDACIKSGRCIPGTEVSVQVNSTDSYNFYVISDNGTDLTLIMDRNLGDNYPWVSKKDYNNDNAYGDYGNNDKGPITILNYLNSETETWTNIPAIESYTYDNNLNGTTNAYGYQKLEIINGTGVLIGKDANITTTLAGTSRARILTYEEASSLNKNNGDITPIWLHDNLGADIPGVHRHYGYWLLTSIPSSINNVYCMNDSGEIAYDAIAYGTYLGGTRPVITISK